MSELKLDDDHNGTARAAWQHAVGSLGIGTPPEAIEDADG